ILSKAEKDNLIARHPESEIFIKKYYGSQEFLKGIDRWCLWITDDNKHVAECIPELEKRIDAVKQIRLASKASETRKTAKWCHKFNQVQHEPSGAIIIPKVSSERRAYIPVGFLDNGCVISDLAFPIYDPPTYIFAVISSRMHMTWVRTVAGRLKTDYRYSSALCYNTFPFPDITDTQKTTLEDHVFQVLDEREQHPEKTMAQLYDPDKMPDGLRQAHHAMDLAVEKCYRSKPFASDEERLEYLFKLYEEMIRAEGKK
ncbi:MAG: class I SAM-dependent DNA methyltransferase, partial [Candidatus Electrothrix sp. ATG2]|nr:class I SAM-dependent DNA methyltransferase [Candidatus Electrothrix sp. ATG2]